MRLFNKINKKKYRKWGTGTEIYNPFVISGEEQIALGSNVKILDNARISIYAKSEGAEEALVQIDDGCYIGYNFSLLVKDKVHIEKNVLIASNVLITSENHGIDPESDLYYMEQPLEGKSVRIGEGTWIGERTCILPGVDIGKKCVIGAGSIVTRDIPDYCIAVGNPARIIKRYNFETHRWEKECV